MPLINDQTKQHYVHRVSYTARERLVGIFIFTGLVALALVAIHSSTADYFKEKSDFYVYIENASGLNTEAPVKIAGVTVGEVMDMGFSHDHRIYVKFFVYEKFRHLVRADSVARINRLAALGSAVLEISPGSLTATKVAAGAFLPVEKTLALDELVGNLATLLGETQEMSFQKLAQDLSALSQNIQSIVAQISSGEGAMGTLVFDKQFGEDFRNLGPILQETKGLLDSIKGSATQMPELVTQITGAVTEANKTITFMNTEMKQMPDTLIHMNLLMKEMMRVLEAMQRVWPLASKVQKPEKRQLIETLPAYE